MYVLNGIINSSLRSLGRYSSSFVEGYILKFLLCYNQYKVYILSNNVHSPIVLSVASPTADPGVASLIPAQSYTFVEIDHEKKSMVILLIQEELLSVTTRSTG